MEDRSDGWRSEATEEILSRLDFPTANPDQVEACIAIEASLRPLLDLAHQLAFESYSKTLEHCQSTDDLAQTLAVSLAEATFQFVLELATGPD